MPRPKKTRFISGYPSIESFVPRGMEPAGELVLSLEELEALRLSDFEGMDQEGAAAIMDVSRQTYGRILGEARRRVSEALVTGKSLIIQGGTYEMRAPHRRRRRRGRGHFHCNDE